MSTRAAAAFGILRRLVVFAACAGSAAAADRVRPGPDGQPAQTRDKGDEVTQGLFLLSPALGVGARHFAFRDALTPGLRSYDLAAAPIVALGGELYPFARERPAVDVGLVGDYQQALFVSSRGPDGASAQTSWRVFQAGLRARVKTGATVVGVAITYGETAFDVGANAPSVRYDYVRGGLDGRYALGPFSVLAGAGYAAVLSRGALDDLFPRASSGGIDAHLGAAYTVARGLELRANLGYTRFFSSMGAQPGDTNVAGGALDQFETATVGAAFAR